MSHLSTAPMCLWQLVLRKSQTGDDRLPRAMPPVLCPAEALLRRRLACLSETSLLSSTNVSNSCVTMSSRLGQTGRNSDRLDPQFDASLAMDTEAEERDEEDLATMQRNFLHSCYHSSLLMFSHSDSTDNEVSQTIQRLVDLFWFRTCSVTNPSIPCGASTTAAVASPASCLWPGLLSNGIFRLPYGLAGHGRLKPLSNHLIRMMSVHLRTL
ncbi:unnamed protein product [Protopolystoma xenopodis]|uniref:Uncharacterized protein n=1 Tax=Protopolystoma xenopodis TaxID=117903 RepID=A0A448XKG1_9PLAT|nr:unnamed protein product [Protopolystoma xenopodis]